MVIVCLKTSFIISGGIPLVTLYISVVSPCILLWWREAELISCKSSSKFKSLLLSTLSLIYVHEIYYLTAMKHPINRTIMKLNFKNCIQKNRSFRQFHIISCFCDSIEFSVCFLTNTLNMNIKFWVIIKIDFLHFFLP